MSAIAASVVSADQEGGQVGVNNRRRRAAKRRKRRDFRPGGPAGSSSREGSGGRNASGSRDGWAGGQDERHGPAGDRWTVTGLLEGIVGEVVIEPRAARLWAERLAGPNSPLAATVVTDSLSRLLARAITMTVGGGWAPSDLAAVTRRRLTSHHVPPSAALLAAEADRHPLYGSPASGGRTSPGSAGPDRATCGASQVWRWRSACAPCSTRCPASRRCSRLRERRPGVALPRRAPI